MKGCVFIVQGEGKGHLSQSLAAREILEQAGYRVEAVFLGCRKPEEIPGYYQESFRGILHFFSSPFLLRTPNLKGIYPFRSVLRNLIRFPVYLKEIRRIRRMIHTLSPEVVINFYELVGALAMRKLRVPVKKVGIGHHFYLHHMNYFSLPGHGLERSMLGLHTRMIMRSCDTILALSHRPVEHSEAIRFIPPLIRQEIKDLHYRPGSRYLVYLLSPGYLYDLVVRARRDPGFDADVYTRIRPAMELPAGIRLYGPDRSSFLEKMATCRGLITTSGFDTVAEASYLGIPLVVVPVRGHFEQYCNSVDTEKNGLGVAATSLASGELPGLPPPGRADYRRWADQAAGLLLEGIKK